MNRPYHEACGYFAATPRSTTLSPFPDDEDSADVEGHFYPFTRF